MVFDPTKSVINQSKDTQFDYSMTGVSLADIVYMDPLRDIVVVNTVDSKKISIPCVNMRGIRGEGSFTLPPSGKQWKAVICEDAGDPYIIRFLPPQSPHADEEQIDKSDRSGGTEKNQALSISYTEEVYGAYRIRQIENRRNYRGDVYYDRVPGDWGWTSPEGNMLGILRGGLNILRTTPLNQILQFTEDDLLRIIARNYQLFTDFGVHKIENFDGKTRVTVRGNSGLNDKFNTREETYEFNMEMGACSKEDDESQMFIKWKYINPNNKPIDFRMDRDGNTSFTTPRDVWVDSGEDLLITVGDHMGVFAGTELKLDAGKLDFTAGATMKKNEDGELVTEDEGYTLQIDQSEVRLGNVQSGNPLLKITDSNIEMKAPNDIKMESTNIQAKASSKNQVIGSDVLLGAEFGQHKELVNKDHFDKYNGLLDTIFELIVAPMLGDLALPIPFVARAQAFDKIIKLQLDHKELFLKNHTSQTKAT
jgi:hypothetical protein